MKKVLFIGVTDLHPDRAPHIRKKFEGLSEEIHPYILGKGGFFRKRVWNTEFYLLPSGFFWILALFFSPWLCWSKKIDAIVAQSPLVEGFFGIFLKKIFRKELIVELHGDWKEGPFLSKKRKFAFIEKKLTPWLAEMSLRSADKIRGVSEDLINEAKKTAPDKRYFLFPTFTDLDDFLAEKDIRFDNFILFVGHDQRVKGSEYLIKAFDSIKEDFPRFRLVLAGRGMPEGRLSLEEIRNKMKNCYCLAVPSLSEGLPRVILEAMALGKPVVASRVGGIPEVVKDGFNGFLFEAGNYAELADKLRALLSDRGLAMKMGENGRELARDNFSNEKYVQNYLRMIYA